MDAQPTLKRKYRGIAPEERVEMRRVQLIEAAIRVYGEVGYRGATVRAICTAAGLSDRYFYEAFDNGEALLAAAFDAVTDEVLSEISRAGDPDVQTGRARGRSILAAYFALLHRERAKARVFLVEMTGISPEIDQVFDTMLMRVAEQLVLTFDPKRQGPLADDPLLARGVASGLIGIATAWVRGNTTESLEAVTTAALRLCTLADPRSGATHR